MLTAATIAPAMADGPEISHLTLENGLELVVIPDRRAPVITHMVFYKAGAADEPRGKSGIAHFLEHLMFKGTEKIGNGEFSKIIARNGGQDNAFTTQDVTAYFQRVAKDKLPVVMEMEADRMVNLRITENDITQERKVIIEERRSRVDNDPSSILGEQMQAALYTAHPYGIPIIGWLREMEGLNRDDAMAFYKRHYGPNNAIVVVAGDVEPQAVADLARQIYGVVPLSKEIGGRARPAEPEPVAERRVKLTDDRVGKATLSRTYLTPGYNGSAPREAQALELLADILGGTNTGRLYKALVVEQKIAATAGGWYAGSGLDSGRFGLYAMAAGNATLADIETAMDVVIADVARSGVTEAELKRVRQAAVAEFVYATDNQMSLARLYGWALATGRTVEDVKEQADRLSAVTVADVQLAAQRWLERRRAVTGELVPGAGRTADAGPVRVPGAGETLH